jgi:hypothetical protein
LQQSRASPPTAQLNAALRRIIGEPRDFRHDSMV